MIRQAIEMSMNEEKVRRETEAALNKTDFNEPVQA